MIRRVEEFGFERRLSFASNHDALLRLTKAPERPSLRSRLMHFSVQFSNTRAFATCGSARQTAVYKYLSELRYVSAEGPKGEVGLNAL